jgi:hypothetical protein
VLTGNQTEIGLERLLDLINWWDVPPLPELNQRLAALLAELEAKAREGGCVANLETSAAIGAVLSWRDQWKTSFPRGCSMSRL